MTGLEECTKARQSKARQSKARQSKAKQSQGKAKQGTAKQSNAKRRKAMLVDRVQMLHVVDLLQMLLVWLVILS